MKIEYRILTRNGNQYFPQCRTKNFFGFWDKWQRIARHTSGTFGIYDNTNLGWTDTKDECVIIVCDYDKWIRKQMSDIDSYEKIEPCK